MMGRWWLVSFLLVTWSCHISPTPTEEDVKPKCCPCPESSEDQRAADTAPSPQLQQLQQELPGSCACGRAADAAAAATAVLPRDMRAPWTYLRPENIKSDPKPLLSPEVGLASSVLETIRDATEEEYREALARDAARNEAKSNEPNARATDSLITVVVDSSEETRDPSASATVMRDDVKDPIDQAKFGKLESQPKLDPELRSFDSDAGASEFSNSFMKVPLELREHLLKSSSKTQLKEHSYLPSVNKLLTSKSIPDFGIKTKLENARERMNNALKRDRILQIPRSKLLPGVRDLVKDRNGDEDNCLSPSNIHSFSKSIDNINMKAKQFHNNLFKLKDVEMIQGHRNTVGSPRQNIFNLPILKDLIDSVKAFTPDLGDIFRKPNENVEQTASKDGENNLELPEQALDSTVDKQMDINIMDTIPKPSILHEVLSKQEDKNNENSMDTKPIHSMINQKQKDELINEDLYDEIIPINTEKENIQENQRSREDVNTDISENVSDRPQSIGMKLKQLMRTNSLSSKSSIENKKSLLKKSNNEESFEQSRESINKEPKITISDLQKMSDNLLRFGEHVNSAITAIKDKEDCEIDGLNSRDRSSSKTDKIESRIKKVGRDNNKITAKVLSPLDNTHDMSHEASNSESRFSVAPKALNDFNRMSPGSILDKGDFLEMKPKLDEIRLKLKNVLDIPFTATRFKTSERTDDIDSNNMKAEGSWPEPRYYYSPNSYQLPWQYYRSGIPAQWSPWTPEQPLTRYPAFAKTDLLKAQPIENKTPMSIVERTQPKFPVLPSEKLILPKIEELQQTLKSHLDDLKQRSNVHTLTALKNNIQTKLNDVLNSMQERVASSIDGVKIGGVKLIGAAINSQPNKLLHVLSKTKSDADEKLQSLHSNIQDRLSELNDKITSSSSSFSPLPRVNNINGKYYVKKTTKPVNTRKLLANNRVNKLKIPSIERSFNNIVLPQLRTNESGNSKIRQNIPQPGKVISQLKPRLREFTNKFNKNLHVSPVAAPNILKPTFRKTLEPLGSATHLKPIGTRMRFLQSKDTELDKLKKSIKTTLDSLQSPSEIISEISQRSAKILKDSKVILPKFDLKKLELPKKSIILQDSKLFRNVENLKSEFSPFSSKKDFLGSPIKPAKPLFKLLNGSKDKFKPVSDMFAKASSLSEKSIQLNDNALKEDVPYKCKMVCSRDSK